MIVKFFEAQRQQKKECNKSLFVFLSDELMAENAFYKTEIRDTCYLSI